MSHEELTDQQEHFCQLVAEGYTQSKAASIAYDTKYPRAIGTQNMLIEKIQNRINQLRDERNKASGITREEQIRRYNDLYMRALSDNKLVVAKQMLERIDAIGGFEAPRTTKNISLKGDTFKGDNLEEDLKRFSGVLQKHSEEMAKESSPQPTANGEKPTAH